MEILLIKDGLVENCILADSVDLAARFYPDRVCLERTAELAHVGPGFAYAGGAFVAPALPADTRPRHLTRFAFQGRFTPAEKVAIEIASLDDPGAPIEQRALSARLRVSQRETLAATYIDLDRADVRDGVVALEAAGLLAAGRALEILDAAVREEERYQGE